MWNSKIKQCSAKLCLNCIDFSIVELKNQTMLIKPLLNYEDYFYCGTLELNNAHQSFAKLHRLLMWNSRMKQC